MVKDVYAIPKIDDFRDYLGGATVDSTIDCDAGHWEISVASQDRYKAPFTAHTGLLRFFRLPFGCVSAPAALHRVLDIILSGALWQTCLMYVDEVIAFSSTVGERIRKLREVLLLLETAGFSL